MSVIKPFENEEDSAAIGDLTVENRVDRISLYGSLQITRDKAGLQLAQELKALIDDVLQVMQSEKLPDQVPLAPTDRVNNPFG
ncbi:hypothetical protein [Noviherbaspirillum massiliense]|uniref:hypothetical protein n=1 Tax=Noviherbaspirillum massiliense TaxID=1465823 RepID=UPI0002E0B927|nr:hypothetical protein [Noviherbaspirillum massiliense]